MLKSSKRKFGEILVSEGLLTKEQVDEALQDQLQYRCPIGEYLMETGQITEYEVARVLSIQYGLPFLRLQGYELRADLFNDLPAETLYRNKVVPLDRIGSCCIVAIGMVPAEEVQVLLAKRLNADIHYYFALVSDVDSCLREKFSLTQEEMLTLASDKPKAPISAEITSGGEDGVFSDLDAGSRESIFDEAEKNVSTE